MKRYNRSNTSKAPAAGGGRKRTAAKVNSTVDVIRYLWPYLRPDRRRLAAAVGVAMVLIALNIGSPLILGLIVGALIDEARPPAWRSPALLLAALAVAAVLRGWLTMHQRRMGARLGQYAAARIREKLWRHVMRLPVTYARERGAGRLLLRFIADARTIQRLVTGGVLRLGQELLMGAAILTAMLAMNWRMALPIVAVVPAYALLLWWLNPELRRHSRAARRRRSRLSGHFAERMEGILVIKSSVRERAERQRGKSLTRDVARRATKMAGVHGRIEGFGVALLGLATAGMLAVALRELTAGRSGGGELVAFIALLGLLAPVFTHVIAANRSLQEMRVSLHRLEQTLARPVESAPEDPRKRLRVTDARLTLDGVSFRHRPDGRPVLEDMHLDVRPGQLIAIAGANGSGKSTLLLLLLGLIRPTSGRVLIDDQDIANVSTTSLRRAVGFVPQEAVVFDGTVEEAVGYGLPATLLGAERRAALERAANLAGLDDLLASLAGGWQARVGLGGRSLSGGQRQRLCLARALAADPKILLLDEPTGALDQRAEAEFANRLRELASTRLVIVVAHREATLRAAGKVLELRRGQLQ